MAQCPNCRNSIREDSTFCPVCGTAIQIDHSYTGYSQPATPVVPLGNDVIAKPNSHDHTKEFEENDVAENKLVCMLVYLLDFFGIILGLLAAKDSPYAGFHIRQSMKYCVLELLLSLAATLLCWTVLVPVLYVIAILVLLVLKFISFTQVCNGKAIEPAIIRNLKFLK